MPWRISIAKQNDFSYQPNAHAEVTEGNTVSWRCEPPDTNPEAYIDYYKDDQLIMPPFEEPKIKSLLLEKVRYEDSGQYKCTAAVNGIKYTSKATLTLKVHRHMENKEPSFIIKPKETYTVTKGNHFQYLVIKTNKFVPFQEVMFSWIVRPLAIPSPKSCGTKRTVHCRRTESI